MKLKGRGSIALGNDIALTILFQALSALISYGAQIMISRTLGESGLDVYALVFSYLILAAAITDFGIVAVVYPRVAVAGGAATPAFFAALRLRAVTFLVGSIGIVLAVWLLEGKEVVVPMLCGIIVLAVSTKLTGFRQIAEMIWRITGRTWLIGAMTAFDSAIFLVVLSLLGREMSLTPSDIYLLLAATSIPTLLIIVIGIRRATRGAAARYRRIPSRYLRMLALASLPIATMAFASQLFGRIEPLIISRWISLDMVGDYTNAVFALGGTTFIPMTIAIGILPIVSQVHRGRRTDLELSWLISTGYRSIGAVAILIGVVSFVLAEQILSLFGPAYVDDAWIMRIYTVTTLLEFLVIFGDQMLIATDRRRALMIGTLLSLGLVILFQIVAINYVGLAGVLYGKIGALIVKILYQHRSFDLRMRDGMRDGIVRILLASVVSGAVVLATRTLPTAIWLLLSCGSALAILFLTKSLDPQRWQRLRAMRLT